MPARLVPLLCLAVSLVAIATTDAGSASAQSVVCPETTSSSCYWPQVTVKIYNQSGQQVTTVQTGSTVQVVTQVDGAPPNGSCSRQSSPASAFTGTFGTGSTGSVTNAFNVTLSSTGTYTFTVSCPATPQAGSGSAQVTAQSTPPPPPPTENNPTGAINTSVDSAGNVTGWAWDADNCSAPVLVELYIDGVPGSATSGYLGAMNASGAGAPSCGGYTNHVFSFTVPNWARDGNVHYLYVQGDNIAPTGSNRLLDFSGVAKFQLAPPPPPVLISWSADLKTAWTGETRNLSWDSNADSCSIASDPAGGGSWSNLPFRGTVTTPALAAGYYKYTITCRNTGGATTGIVYVEVKDGETGTQGGTGANSDPTSDWDAVLSCRWKAETNYVWWKAPIGERYRYYTKVSWCVSNGFIRKVARETWVTGPGGSGDPAGGWEFVGTISWGPCNENCDNYTTLFGQQQTSKNIWVQGHFQWCLTFPLVGAVYCKNTYPTVGVLIRGDGTRDDTYGG